MDRIDLAILETLQQHGRLSNQELADTVGLSPSPCLRRVKRLEEIGVIRGYRAVVDQSLFGLPITAFVRIRLEMHTAQVVSEVERKIREIDHIVEAYLMAGDADFLLKVVIESLDAYEALVRTQIRQIPSIASIETSFAYGTTKHPAPFPAPQVSSSPSE